MDDVKDPTFVVMGKRITLISDECYFGRNTVADIEGVIHYMGNEYPTLSTAIFAWQEVNDRMLNNEEIRQVMIENGLIQSGEKNASQEEAQEGYRQVDPNQECGCQEITDEDIIEITDQVANQDPTQSSNQEPGEGSSEGSAIQQASGQKGSKEGGSKAN